LCPVLIFYRYRQLAKANDPALSTNSTIHRRSLRTRRRLYLMVLSIILPFYPIVVLLAVLNIIYMHGLKPFDYDLTHDPPGPFPWNTIFMFPSDQVGWAYRNTQYIAILTAAPIFGFFGTTRDAMNIYRKGFLLLGLGHIFPSLREVYDPDKDKSGSGSYGSTVTATMRGLVPTHEKRSHRYQQLLTSRSSSSARKGSTAYSHALKSINSSSSASGTRRGSVTPGQEPIVVNDVDLERGQEPVMQRPQSVEARAGANETVPDPIHRNPFPFRTHFNLHLPRFGRSTGEEHAPATRVEEVRPVSYASQTSDASHTRTSGSHDDEACLNTGWAADERSRGQRA